jgi:glycosyltransferase involved in cell wall biosynthesis
MKRRLIIDMSDIWLYLARNDRLTGIQRVVFQHTRQLLAQDDIEVHVGYYDPRYGYYAQLPTDGGLIGIAVLGEVERSKHIRPWRPEKYRSRPIAGLLHFVRTRFPPLLRRWRTAEKHRPRQFPFQKGDIVLSLGEGWVASEMIRLVKPLVQSGDVTLFAMIHDMIPAKDIDGPPQTRDVAPFGHWLSEVTKTATALLVTSDSTHKDLATYLEASGTDGCIIAKTPLAHEFLPIPIGETTTDQSPDPRELYVLCVSSWGLPHKNIERLLDAWERLRSRLGAQALPRLMIAGGVSRDKLPVGPRDRLGDHLMTEVRPSDARLESLYRNALFTVFPSIYEGWGLPIGESLWMGKFCVTSNTSSMPEVGGSLCDYFDPHDVDSMVAALERSIRDRDYLCQRAAQIRNAELISWAEAAAGLRDTVMRVADGG